MIHKWKIGILLGLVMVLLVITACGSDSTGSDGKTDLSIMWWGPQERHEATLAALDIYKDQNPDITFTAEHVAWDGFWDRLPTLAAAGDVPDILQMDGAFIDEYVTQGVLADLSDIDLEGLVDPRIIENLLIDGKLYGVPLSHNAQGFVYNKALVEEYEVTEPFKDWTWEEYFDFAREAREKLPDNMWGITDGTVSWDWYQYYQTAKGLGPIFEDGGKRFNLDRDLWFEFQEIYLDFRENNIIPPPDIGFVDNDPQGDPVASGRVLIKPATVGSVSVLENLLPGDVDVVNLPTGPAGGGWAQSTIFLSASADGKHLDEAKKFIRWFISDLEAGKALGTTRGLPINDAVFAELEPNLTRVDTIGRDLLDVSIDSALPFYPLPAGWQEYRTVYEAEMEAVQFGQRTLEQAYENITKVAAEIEDRVNRE